MDRKFPLLARTLRRRRRSVCRLCCLCCVSVAAAAAVGATASVVCEKVKHFCTTKSDSPDFGDGSSSSGGGSGLRWMVKSV